MDSKDKFTILKDSFEKQGSDEKIQGLTLIVDGKLKEVFDTIIYKSEKYEDYSGVMSDIIILGINKIINDL